MSTNRRKKRLRKSKLDKAAKHKSSLIGGRCLVGFWAVSLALTGTALLLFRYQYDREGHAEIPLALVAYLAGMIILAIFFTIQWFRSRQRVVR